MTVDITPARIPVTQPAPDPAQGLLDALEQIVSEFGGIPNGHRAAVIANDAITTYNEAKE